MPKPARALEARAFVRWAVRNHLAHGLSIRRGPHVAPVSTVPLARQREVAAGLRHNLDVPVPDRLAGLLVVLYAQLFTRIARMPRRAIAVGEDGTIQLTLGSERIALPPEVAALAEAQTEAAESVASPWLFPSRHDPHPPVSVGTLRCRLRALGLTGAIRAACLVDLARQLPAPVLRDALGIHGNTAARWTAAAGGSWAGYTALRGAPVVPQPSQDS